MNAGKGHHPNSAAAICGKERVGGSAGKDCGGGPGGLISQYGDLRKHLYNDEGKLRSFVNIYVGDEDIRFLQKEQTPLKEDDVISIVPSIAGGTALRRLRSSLCAVSVASLGCHPAMPGW